jgi:dihydroxy-acid dehydratase
MKALLDGGFLHGDCMTVTGRTIAENMASVKWNEHQDVILPGDEPDHSHRWRRRIVRQPRA